MNGPSLDNGPGLHVGARGELGGVPVEVLGWTAWRTGDGYPYHEVVLRTEDAAWWWLEVDAGHITLHRPVKAGFDLDPLAPPDGQRVRLDRRRRAFPLGRASLTHVEGEYWKDLQVGARIEYRPFYHGATVIGASREIGEDAWEWSQGVYLEQRVVERAFGVALPGPAADEAHPARPYPRALWARALYRALPLGLLAAITGLVLLATQPSGGDLLQQTVVLDQAEGSRHLGVFDSEAEQTIGIALGAEGLHNTWGYAEIALTPVPPDGATPDTFDPEALVSAKVDLSYYTGTDSDGRWVEDDTHATDGFRIGAGSYMVFVSWELDPGQRAPVRLSVRVAAGYVDPTPLIVLGLIFLGLWVVMSMARASYRRRAMVDAGLIADEEDD